MKQIVVPQPFRVEVREVPIPVPESGEVLLRMRYGGICGSDLGIYRGTMPYGAYPRVPGHELAAEVVRAVDGVEGWKPGTLVTVNPYFNCGSCYSCRRGLVNCCTGNETMGVQRDGGFSEYIAIPAERLYDAQGLDAKTLAMVEPFCISYHGVRSAGVTPGERVLVVGAGTIGVLAAVSAKLMGAQVTICDVAPAKLEQAKVFEVDSTILNDSPAAFADGVSKTAGGDGFDVTVEAVGLPSTFQNCIDAAAFGGRMVQIGVGSKTLDFAFTTIQKKELRIIGSRNAVKQDFEEVIGFISSGRVKLEHLITEVYPAERAGEAYTRFDKEAGNVLKLLVEFSR